jgi:hypothetical protein
VKWLLDWWQSLLERPAAPQYVAAAPPKTEEQLVYELVVQLLSTPHVEFKRYDKELETWSEVSRAPVYIHWLTNEPAALSVQVDVNRHGVVIGTKVWVGGDALNMSARQALDLMGLLNRRLDRAAADARQARTREQLRLLVEASERLL